MTAIIGAVSGFGTDLAIQIIGNKIEGKKAFSDIKWKSVAISTGIGALAGATGLGAPAQGKKAIKAIKIFKIYKANVKARKIAVVAGKFRNPVKTALKIAGLEESKKTIITSVLKGSSMPILKKALKAGIEELSKQNDATKESMCNN